VASPKILQRNGKEAQAAGEGARAGERASQQAGERASEQAGGWAHEQRADERSSVRRGSEQATLNMVPIVDCEGRCFAVVYKQTGNRGAFKQFGTLEGRVVYEYKVTFCTSNVK